MKSKFLKTSALLILVLGIISFSSENNNLKKITSDRAKQIVLSRVAGATKENIKNFESDKDSYDGVIYFNGVEYKFEIDAFTGRIINWKTETK